MRLSQWAQLALVTRLLEMFNRAKQLVIPSIMNKMVLDESPSCWSVKALTWSCIVGPSASPYSRRESRVAPRDHRQLDRSIVRRCASDCLKDKAGMAHKTDSWMLRRTRRGMLLLRKAPTTLQVRAARIMRRAISEMLVLETMWGVF